MAENPNVAMLRRCYDRWHETRGGSVGDWLAIIDEPFELISMAGGRTGVEFTATGTDRAHVERYLAGLTEGWEMHFYGIDEYVAAGDTVVAIGSTAWTNRLTGKHCETRKADVWRFRNGKAVSFCEFYDSAGVIAAATPDVAALAAI